MSNVTRVKLYLKKLFDIDDYYCFMTGVRDLFGLKAKRLLVFWVGNY